MDIIFNPYERKKRKIALKEKKDKSLSDAHILILRHFHISDDDLYIPGKIMP